jgi:hypothetical protein
MSIETTPTIYTPPIDINGNYIAEDECIHMRDMFAIGFKCGCKSNTVWKDRTNFRSHLKTNSHIKWIEQLNNNKQNYYQEATKLNEVVKTQQQLIISLENKCEQYKTEIVNLLIENRQYKNRIETSMTSINLIDL